jgi:hypothetical protein
MDDKYGSPMIKDGAIGLVNRNFTLTNHKGKEIEFRFIAKGAPYGLGAINKGEHPLWEVSSNGFTLGQWRVETIADHKDGEGWCLHGGAKDYDLDASLASIAKQNSVQALEEKAAI